ncbi:MbtH family NRPS accessory protein [Streptomyces sp. NPDC006906]|uniref:MbtH family protein n=1 Tax=unclassified Streptomyces TaxID=2593676 RepID=UPI0033DE48B3
MTDEQEFTVVVNHEEQYSIWWSHRALPPGWVGTGFSGSRAECLSHIAGVWSDMRPLSLRKRMDGAPA